MARYQPLTDRLQETDQDRQTLTFDELDALVGGLPASARRHRAWWANEADPRAPQKRAWVTAGYRVDDVSPSVGVTFVRVIRQSVEPVIARPSGDSAEQRYAESLVIEGVAKREGCRLTKARLTIHEATVEVDGLCEDPPVLVEAWAHQGLPKPAQKAKVMTDALRLTWIERVRFPGGATKILALGDELAASHFVGTSWMAVALRDLGVRVAVVPLPPDVRAAISAAQVRQIR